jgi:hypothetical protein
MSLNGRQKAANVLETWDLQAMHALNSGEVAVYFRDWLMDRVLLKSSYA